MDFHEVKRNDQDPDVSLSNGPTSFDEARFVLLHYTRVLPHYFPLRNPKFTQLNEKRLESAIIQSNLSLHRPQLVELYESSSLHVCSPRFITRNCVPSVDVVLPQIKVTECCFDYPF